MLLAHRHGKLRVTEDAHSARSAIAWNEDLITSYVFGLLRYLSPDRGLAHILREVFPRLSVPANLTFVPWPRNANLEPDGVLLGDGFACVLEAKWDAPFGVHQLGKEWLWLSEHHAAPVRALLTVTRYHVSQVEILDTLEEDLRALGAHAAIPHPHQVGALTWSQLAQIVYGADPVTPAEQAIFDDLAWALESCGARQEPFAGWDVGSLPSIPSNFDAWYGSRYFDLLAPPGAGAWRQRLDADGYYQWGTT